MLFYTFAMTMVMLPKAAGDEFAECTSGSFCPAWIAMVGSSRTKVAIQESVKSTKSQYYRIEVTPGSGAAAFHKFRRYSEFLELHEGLADGLEEFPPKLFINSLLEKFWPKAFDERRTKLEAWLQAVLNKEESKGAWADALFVFLDPAGANAGAKSGVSMPPDANKICHNEVHYFGISVTLPGAEPIQVFHRYSDFNQLNASLAELGAKESDFSATLPPKLVWNHFITMWESKVEERHRGLEAWLQQVKLHPDSAPGGRWAEKVKEFLDPEANKKAMSWNCLGQVAAQVTMDQMEQLYNKMKDKWNEFSDTFNEPAAKGNSEL